MKRLFIIILILSIVVLSLATMIFVEKRTTGYGVQNLNSCVDTDGGLNLELKGKCIAKDGETFDDYCFTHQVNGQTILREYWCTVDGFCGYKDYNCIFRYPGSCCEDGRCVK